MVNETIEGPKQNYILSALSNEDYARPIDDLEQVSLRMGQVLFEPGDTIDYVYFPTSCVVSLIYATRDGLTAELAMTGREGLVGVSLVLGGNTIPHRVVVQYPGNAYRLRAEVMRWELAQGGGLQQLSLRYAKFLLTQMSQNIVCNRHHSIEDQVARWILLSLDRLPGNQLDMTQERIAHTLGVRREGVTEAAGKLQAAGLIEYSRGHITVTNRAGLEARACECYSSAKAEHDCLKEVIAEARVRDRRQDHFPQNPETLRQRAEAHLQRNGPMSTLTVEDNARLLHELQVHQIELEMQNEELRNAYNEADLQARRYADIYDFAPVSYFTLNREGFILDLNLAGAILIGIKRSQKGRSRFGAAISPDSRPTFQKFLEETLAGKARQTCDVELLPTSRSPAVRVRIEAVPDEDLEECRMVVITLPPERRARLDWRLVTSNRRREYRHYGADFRRLEFNPAGVAEAAGIPPAQRN